MLHPQPQDEQEVDFFYFFGNPLIPFSIQVIGEAWSPLKNQLFFALWNRVVLSILEIEVPILASEKLPYP